MKGKYQKLREMDTQFELQPYLAGGHHWGGNTDLFGAGSPGGSGEAMEGVYMSQNIVWIKRKGQELSEIHTHFELQSYTDSRVVLGSILMDGMKGCLGYRTGPWTGKTSPQIKAGEGWKASTVQTFFLHLSYF